MADVPIAEKTHPTADVPSLMTGAVNGPSCGNGKVI